MVARTGVEGRHSAPFIVCTIKHEAFAEARRQTPQGRLAPAFRDAYRLTREDATVADISQGWVLANGSLGAWFTKHPYGTPI